MEKYGKLISIIIPVHNTEAYLYECIDSIVEQSLFPYAEVLLIDNGSTDNSADICRKFEKRHDNIYFFQQKTAGVSKARNFGLSMATGKYVMFVDSDDYIMSEMLQVLFQFAESKKADVVYFNYYTHYSSGKDETINLRQAYLTSSENISSDLQYESLLYRDGYQGYIWNKMYKRALVSNIRFSEQIFLLEDFIFNLDVIPVASRFFCLSKPLYFYRQRTESIVHSKNRSQRQSYSRALRIVQEKVPLKYASVVLLMRKISLLRWSCRAVFQHPIVANYYRSTFKSLPETKSKDGKLAIDWLERLALNAAKRSYWLGVAILIIRGGYERSKRLIKLNCRPKKL